MRTVDGNNNHLEAWKNNTKALLSVMRFDRRGDVKSEEIPSGKMLNITPEERRMNQEACADEAYDFFSNGMLTPVRLIESDEDFERITSNKNLISEDDMKAMLKQKRGFKAAIGEITNVNTLRRIAELAKAEDDVSLKQMRDLEDRIIALVEPQGNVQEVEVINSTVRPTI